MSDAPNTSAPDPAHGGRPTVFTIAAPPQRGATCLGFAFGLSLLFNVLLLLIGCLGIALFRGGDSTPGLLTERYHSGSSGASNKIAIIQVDGVLLEGLLDYPLRQIKQAAKDKDVKAIVLRVNSPGGSITASDDLHHQLLRLSENKIPEGTGEKPIVASMDSIAASGGYYICMPAKTVFAEQTTITGSIGVYAALPNVEELSNKVGVKMVVVKRGEIKDSGSPFKEMTVQEREVWDQMVEDAYERFLEVVASGRPKLTRARLREPIPETRKLLVRDANFLKLDMVEFVRRRADGGIFTARQAHRFGLIDRIGFLEDAIAEAASQAGLGTDYKAIRYEKPKTLTDFLLGAQAQGKPAALLDPGQLASGLTPRLWYLAPQSELAGLAASVGR